MQCLTSGQSCNAWSAVSLRSNLFAAPPTTVGRDDGSCVEVKDACLQRLRREPPKNDAVGNAKPCAGQHGNRQLRNHRHIDDGAVACLEAQLLQHVGKPRYAAVQLLIGKNALVAGLTFPNNRRFVLPPGQQVTVKAVVAHVRLAADEPLGKRRIPLQHPGPLFEPVEFLLRKPPPKTLPGPR